MPNIGLQLSPGPYFLRFDGTVSDIGGPILAGLSAGLDQSETYAMMLAGLGAVSFVGWRRRHTV